MVAGWLWAQHTSQDHGFGISDQPWLGILVPVFLMIFFQVPLRLPGLKSPRSGIITLVVLALLTLTGLVLIGPIAISAGIVAYVLLGLINLVIKWY